MKDYHRIGWYSDKALDVCPVGSRFQSLPRRRLFHWKSMLFTSRMASFGLLRRVVLVRTDVSEEFSASFIWMIRLSC
jgi:hypothetical protein